MGNMLNYLWLILIAIYIISPFDAHPLFFDDIIAAGVLLYILYKNSLKKKRYQQYYSNSSHRSNYAGADARQSQGSLTLDKAYDLLGIPQKASWEEIQKAYKEKMSKSHPDKVHHLSEELQEKAKELTLELNHALELIKQHRGITS